MDRNLGAMGNFGGASRKGMKYYQFGRKDPYTTESLYKYNGSKYISVEKSTGSGTLPSSVRAPFTYYLADGLSFVDKDHNYGNTLWYNPTWNLNMGNTQKSLFDPCPVGWRLPVIETWSGIGKTTNGKFDMENNGWILSCDGSNIIGESTVWYPFTCFIWDSAGAPVSNYDYGCAVYSATPPYLTFWFTKNSINVYRTGFYKKGTANPVRCIQE